MKILKLRIKNSIYQVLAKINGVEQWCDVMSENGFFYILESGQKYVFTCEQAERFERFSLYKNDSPDELTAYTVGLLGENIKLVKGELKG